MDDVLEKVDDSFVDQLADTLENPEMKDKLKEQWEDLQEKKRQLPSVKKMAKELINCLLEGAE